MKKPADRHVERRGPAELRDPFVREEMKRASVWFAFALLIGAVILLAQPLLLILAGIVFAAILDGGTRLLGRVLPIGRGWRLAIITIAGVAFILGTFVYTGFELIAQAEGLQRLVTTQIDHILAWATRIGIVEQGFQPQQLSQQLVGTLGRLTSAVGTAVGALTSMLMILVIGLFIASEPRLYERGIAWMLPLRNRDSFYRTTERMGWTLRRLMFGRLTGMAFEGFFTWLLLTVGGVPLAPVLGILTGLLAFIPNIGAPVSGALLLLVGFSQSNEAGLWALGVYFLVQTFDAYVVVPFVARTTVQLPPALILGAQLLFGALFGILGLMLADPIVALAKTALEQKSREDEGRESDPAAKGG